MDSILTPLFLTTAPGDQRMDASSVKLQESIIMHEVNSYSGITLNKTLQAPMPSLQKKIISWNANLT